MASNPCLVLVVALVATVVLGANAGDPDILSDFVVPEGVTADANFFTFRGLKEALWGTTPPMGSQFKVTKASALEFPALMGQSVSLAVLQFAAAGGVNGPHTHPRSAELLLVVKGWLEVGFVDSSNKLFTQTLGAGEAFLFPKGLVHFQINKDPKFQAIAVSAFGSANAGTVVLPLTLFGSGISTNILAKSFKVDDHTIEKLLWSTTQD